MGVEASGLCVAHVLHPGVGVGGGGVCACPSTHSPPLAVIFSQIQLLFSPLGGCILWGVLECWRGVEACV